MPCSTLLDWVPQVRPKHRVAAAPYDRGWAWQNAVVKATASDLGTSQMRMQSSTVFW